MSLIKNKISYLLLLATVVVCIFAVNTGAVEAERIDGVKTVNGVKVEAVDKATPLDDLSSEELAKATKSGNVDPSIGSPYLQAEQMKGKEGVRIVCYHDVVPDSAKTIGTYEMKQKTLREHFKYYKAHGYKIISLDEYIQIAQGTKKAAHRSVLLTFDDGDQSLYNYAYPVLKEYKYPAVAALITSKVGSTEDGKTYVTWDQVKEMDKSGLVDFGSHTDDQHYWDTIDSNENYLQATSHNLWSEANGYESESDYTERMKRDIEWSQEVLEKNLGHKSRVFVWPYGEYTKVTMSLAKDAGFDLFMTLIDGMNYGGTEQAMQYARRQMFCAGDEISKFIKTYKDTPDPKDKTKTVQVSIDDLYVKGDLNRTTANVDKLIENMEDNEVDGIFLEAFSEPKQDGKVEGVYFNTKNAPVIENVYNHIAIKLGDAGYNVYAVLPTLNSPWLLNNDNAVTASSKDKLGEYNRVSPFADSAMDKLGQLYADFALQAYTHGILFGDDLYLNPYEDFSSDAKAAYQQKFGKALDANILSDAKRVQEWEQWKTTQMNGVSDQLMNNVYNFRPTTVSARDLYAPVIFKDYPNGYAQNYLDALKRYDKASIMTYTYSSEYNGKYDCGTIKSVKDMMKDARSIAGSKDKVKNVAKIKTRSWLDSNIATDVKSADKEAKSYDVYHVIYDSTQK